MKTTLKIEFDNEEAAKHFALWLCGSGEQQYWEWMEYREEEEEGNITAVNFHYRGEPVGDKGYGDLDFVEDLTIRTTCGRQDTSDAKATFEEWRKAEEEKDGR